MCLVSLCIQDAPLCIRLVLTQFPFLEKRPFKRRRNSSARCYQKFELSKQLVGFVFASPLYTTEASNVQVNLLQFTL